jgi:hypothetical protein
MFQQNFRNSMTLKFYQIDGKWEMNGPPEVLVDVTSATQSRGLWESKAYFVQAINKNHQEMVKYSRGDDYYQLVKGRLEDISEKSIATIHKRFQAQSKPSMFKAGRLQQVSRESLLTNEYLRRSINMVSESRCGRSVSRTHHAGNVFQNDAANDGFSEYTFLRFPP